MTPLSSLYDAIVARLAAAIPSADVRERMTAMEMARWRGSKPLIAVHFVGREAADPPVIGRSWQEATLSWEIDIIVPAGPPGRNAAEDQADSLALQVVDTLAPLDNSWKPASDCSPMTWETTEVLGDTQNGYAVAVIMQCRQWR